MKQKSRTYNSIFNSAVGIIAAIFNVALNFAVRIAIVHALGEEINGLHSLFQNLISIIAVVETSMTTAMIIHLYEPIKHNDVQGLSKILSFYHRIYVILAVVFLLVGGLLNIFLEHLVITNIPALRLHFYFLIFTVSIAVSYLTYTYRVVLFAEQKNRVSSIATLVAEIIFRGGAALTAIVFHSYTIFLVCFIGEKLCGNLICRFYVRREHKGVSCTVKNADNHEMRSAIMATVKPLLVSRMADIVQNSSQSILISILLGNIAIVGYYGNYMLVIGSVGLLFSQLGASFTSSFGNLATESDKQRMYHAYRKADFIMSSVAIVICAGFLACIQDFIALAFGLDFLLGKFSVIILTFTMFFTLLNIPCISVQNATGRHDADVKNMVIQAICSVVCGYLGGTFWGMEGLLLGTLIPLIIFTTIIKGAIIQNRVLERNLLETFGLLIINVGKGLVVFAINFVVTGVIDTGMVLVNILIKGLVTVVISSCMIVLLSIKNPYLKSTVNLMCRLMGRNKG